ncbi:MAG: N-acetylmuramoyl-L-alanine amidase [Chthoniobacteraceae bacterium]
MLFSGRRWQFLCGLVLALLLMTATGAEASFSTVVIDAGHGGHDRGGIPGQRASEKAATLGVALRLQKILRANGLHTVMTRSGDYFVSLPGRVAIANAQRHAVFVCIHFNSATREGAMGIETYYYSRSSRSLATAIHSAVVRAAGTPNRGLRVRGYYVLRKNRIPAVLVECGFLTNPLEARRAQSGEYLDRLARAIASAVLRASGR